MQSTRRKYIAMIGAVGGGAMTGCLGGNTNAGGTSNDVTGPLECDVGAIDRVSSLPTPTRGSDDAPVTVAVFEDFACPHCQTFSLEVAPKIVSNYVEQGDVQYQYFDFPIPVSEWSWRAASASRAVHDKADDEAFFDFITSVYEQQSELNTNGYQIIHDIASSIEVDNCFVAASAKQEPYRPVIEDTRQQGVDRGVDSTPTIFVNGIPVSRPDWSSVKSAIEAEFY